MSDPRTRPRRVGRLAIWLATAVAAGVGVVAVATPSHAAGPLRTVAPANKFIGYAAAADLLCNNQAACTSGSNATYRNLAGSEFNQVTAENAMKWEATEPSPNAFNFAQADGIMAFAAANSQIVHGHTLLWHSQTPAYVQNLSGAAMRDALQRHITVVAGRYASNPAMRSWDVVNEVINDNSSPQLRPSFWTSNYGGNFVRDAFTMARAADPDAILCINDYSVESDPMVAGTKSNRLFQLVQTEKAAGTPIDCVGLQGHFIVNQLPNLQTTISRYASLGVTVRISELDIRIPLPVNAGDPRLTQQANNYASVINACKAVAACLGVTIWGIDDGHSWLPNSCCPEGAPLLWDSAFNKKPAYDATANALGPPVTDTTPPSTPTNLASPSQTSSSINLTWTASTDNVGVTGYDVLRAPGATGGTFAVIGTATTNSFSNTGLTADTTFRYQVRARDAAGNMSAVSNTVTAATGPATGDTQPPTTPGTLTATGATATSVSLSWGASTDNVGVTGYDVLRAPGATGGTFAVVGTSTTTTFTDPTTTAASTFRFQVRARDAAGNLSPVSNTITVTTPGGQGGGCTATPVVQTSWPTGYVIQPMNVTNTGTATISTWTVTFTLPAGHAITGSWNTTLTISGQNVTARPVSFNSTIAAGATQNFGFQVSRPNGNTALITSATCTSP